MIINQSILPFYSNRAYQHTNFKWYAQKAYGPFIAPVGYLPTFQIIRTTNIGSALTVTLRNVQTNTDTDITTEANNTGLSIDSTYSFDVILYAATLPISITDIAEYEIIISDGSNEWVSERWAMSSRTNEMIKLTYWHLEDLVFDQDDNNDYVIRYAAPFKNTVYIDNDLFKPQYPYYREVDRKLGRNFDKLHISAKEYVFDFPATEDLIDAVRLIPLHDRKTAEFKGRTYVIDELLVEPEWQAHGDIALVKMTFRSNTVAVVAGRSSNATYEPTPGSCVTLAHNCVGLVVDGSAEYLAYQYTDSNGDTQDLQDGEKVLVESSGGSLRVYSHNASSYTLETTAAQTVVFVQSNSLYYSGIGSNTVVLPGVFFYGYGSGQIAGTFLPGGTHQLYYTVGAIEVPIGNYTYTQLAIDGVFVTLPDEAEFIRMRIASAACGIFQETTDYELQEPPSGDVGIGFDVISTTLKVY